jgi:hypothetical protein
VASVNSLKSSLAYLKYSHPEGCSDPELTFANLIMSTILAPPFAWSWNRTRAAFVVPRDQTDRTIYLPDFGWIESATDKLNQPVEVTAVNDNNAGGITFRTAPVSSDENIVVLTYQKAPRLFHSLSDTWAPVPDKYSFMYERALNAHLLALENPAVYLTEMEGFYRQLIGNSENGLDSDQQRIFLEDRLSRLRE